MELTITTPQIQVSLAQHQQVQTLFFFLDRVADSINFFQFTNVCLQKLHFAIAVESLALSDDALGSRSTTTYDVDARGDGIAEEGFESCFAYS